MDTVTELASAAKQTKRNIPADRPVGQQTALASARLPVTAIPHADWQALATRAIEQNGYHLPHWLLALSATSRGRTDIAALTAWRSTAAEPELIGVLPVASAWRALKLPLPVLVSADVYATLSTPVIDAAHSHEAVTELLRQARASGARALLLQEMTLDGDVMQHLTRILAADGIRPRVLRSHRRAMLDASRDADELLRDGLGPKKLKELRRQRNRLAELGEVTFRVASAPDDIAAATEEFLQLEASGWKAKRGTALLQRDGDGTFVRRAVADLAKLGQCEVISLRVGPNPVAAAVVLRQGGRAFYFKMGVDEAYAKYSTGVQLTVELTRHLCADPEIHAADSSAIPGHPMIEPIWRARLAIGDVLIPLTPRDPMIPVIAAAIKLRFRLRGPLRKLVQLIRSRKE